MNMQSDVADIAVLYVNSDDIAIGWFLSRKIRAIEGPPVRPGEPAITRSFLSTYCRQLLYKSGVHLGCYILVRQEERSEI
ncbi:hypothetical protein IAD21_00654 [Abditibacteriota bacterium]|nr:hypothetical protein IAD21_00654 [Abditibacteriota bacterium]